MCDATAVGRVVSHALIGEWAALLRTDGLNREGLITLRSELDSPEFACPHGRALLLAVIERLAPLRGIEPCEDDLWGEIVGTVPDDVSELDGRPPAW